MTTNQDLELRLRNLSMPASPPAGFQDQLRADLRRRAARNKSNRSIVTAVAVLVVFSATLMQETPLESVNNELGYIEIHDGDGVEFKGHGDANASIGYAEGLLVDGKTTMVPVSPERAAVVAHQQEVIAGLHAASMTRLQYITGYTVNGKSRISAGYHAVIDGEDVPTSEILKNDFSAYNSPLSIHDDFSAKISQYLQMHLDGELEPLSPEVLIVDGIEREVARSRALDDEIGEYIVWYSRYEDGP